MRLTETFRAGFAPEGSPHLSIWDFLADPDQRSRLGRVLEGRLLRADLALPSPAGSVAAEAEAVLDATVTRHALLTVAPAGPDPEPRSGADALLADPSLDDSPAVVWIKDLSGRYLRVNRRYTERLDIAASVITGKGDAELSPAHVVPEPRLLDQRDGEPAQLEYTVEASNGREALTVLRFPLHGLDGAAIAVCGVAASVADAATARLEAERLLRIERWAGLSAAAIRAELLEEWQLAEVEPAEPVEPVEPVAETMPAAATQERPAEPVPATAAELERLARELAAARSAAAELETSLAEEAARNARLGEELTAATQRAEELVNGAATEQNQLTAIQAAAEVERTRAEGLAAEVAAERARAEGAEREVAAARVRVQGAEREVAAARARVAELKSAQPTATMATERTEAEQARGELVARAAQAEAASGEAQAASERAAVNVKRAEAAAELSRSRAEGLEAALASARELEAESRTSLEHAHAEITTLQATLGELRTENESARETAREAVAPSSGPTWSHGAQRVLAASLADATEWRTGLKDAVRVLGTEGRWDVVVAWCPDERAGALRCAAMWMSAPDQLGLFETTTWQRRQSPAASAAGRATGGDRATWLSDLSAVDDAQLTAAAGEGMRLALLVPIRHGGETSGVLELLTRAPGAPDPEISSAMEAVALQLAQFEYLLRRGAEPRWRIGRM